MPTLKTGLRELANSLAIVLVVAIISASLPWLNGRDIAFTVFRAREAEREPAPAALDAIRQELDLPDNAFEGIMKWLTDAVRGDFGVSWVDPSTTAAQAAWSGLPNSLRLAFFSMLTSILLGWVLATPRMLGIARGRRLSSASVLLTSLVGGIPMFVSAAGLLVLFGLYFPIFPISGLSSPVHYVLPLIALSMHSGGMLGRILIIAADGVRQEQWLTSWRVNGVPLLPRFLAISQRCWVVMGPQVALMFASSVAATVLIEATYNIPGFGNAALEASKDQDIPVLQLILLTTVALGLVMGLASRLITFILLWPMAGADNSYASFTGSHQRGSSRLDWTIFLLAVLPLVLIFLGLGIPNPQVDLAGRLAAPGADHWLGADALGRDLFARLAHGAPYTIGVAVAVTAACALIGLLFGLTGTWSQRIGFVLNALPEVFVGLILAGVMGGSLLTAATAVVLVGWIPLAAHTSMVASEIRQSGYVAWARAQGANSRWIYWHHVVPGVIPAVVRHGASRVASSALALASLGYLGIGAPHDSPEWGVVLAEAIPYAERAPWLILAPTVLLMCLGATSALGVDLRVGPRKKAQPAELDVSPV